MSERIEAKIAKITSERELILNKGSEAGVEPDMIFRVKGQPVEVNDPDTGESLGRVSSIKVYVKVSEVDERFAIARTFRSRRVNLGGSGGFGNLFQPPRYETKVETLRRDPAAEAPISESEAVVEVGDVAESLLEGEEYENTTTALWL